VRNVDNKYAASARARLSARSVADGDCLIWLGRLNRDGYGTIKVGRATMLAHRVAVELARGPIPGDKVLDHLCRRRNCINVGHLEAVTQQENVLRGEGLARAYADRTHCDNGHLLAGDNVRLRSSKRARVCRECKRQRDGSVGVAPALRTHCPAGHPFDAANALISGGSRVCRACKRDKARARRTRAEALRPVPVSGQQIQQERSLKSPVAGKGDGPTVAGIQRRDPSQKM
jgi:hypothetical protein